MTTLSGYKKFGVYLRDARKRRGLTLDEVARSSKDVATDSDGSISQPHLSLIETGRPIEVSLSKLLTLGALYRLSPSDIIDRAPAKLRTILSEKLAQWQADNKPIPPFVPYLPRVVEQVDAEVYHYLENFARDVRAPLGDEVVTRRTIRQAIIPATIPVYLRSAKSKPIPDFWLSDFDFKVSSYDSSNSWWWDTTQKFHDWLLYERRLVTDIIKPLSYWTIDFASAWHCLEGTQLASCAFTDPALNAVYGFQNTPIAAVIAVRWRQTAALLYESIPSKSDARRKAPNPPPALDGLLECFARLISPLLMNPIIHPAGSPAEFAATIRALQEAIPALNAEVPASNRPIVAALASLARNLDADAPKSRGKA